MLKKNQALGFTHLALRNFARWYFFDINEVSIVFSQERYVITGDKVKSFKSKSLSTM